MLSSIIQYFGSLFKKESSEQDKFSFIMDSLLLSIEQGITLVSNEFPDIVGKSIGALESGTFIASKQLKSFRLRRFLSDGMNESGLVIFSPQVLRNWHQKAKDIHPEYYNPDYRTEDTIEELTALFNTRLLRFFLDFDKKADQWQCTDTYERMPVEKKDYAFLKKNHFYQILINNELLLYIGFKTSFYESLTRKATKKKFRDRLRSLEGKEFGQIDRDRPIYQVSRPEQFFLGRLFFPDQFELTPGDNKKLSGSVIKKKITPRIQRVATIEGPDSNGIAYAVSLHYNHMIIYLDDDVCDSNKKENSKIQSDDTQDDQISAICSVSAHHFTDALRERYPSVKLAGPKAKMAYQGHRLTLALTFNFRISTGSGFNEKSLTLLFGAPLLMELYQIFVPPWMRRGMPLTISNLLLAALHFNVHAKDAIFETLTYMGRPDAYEGVDFDFYCWDFLSQCSDRERVLLVQRLIGNLGSYTVLLGICADTEIEVIKKYTDNTGEEHEQRFNIVRLFPERYYALTEGVFGERSENNDLQYAWENDVVRNGMPYLEIMIRQSNPSQCNQALLSLIEDFLRNDRIELSDETRRVFEIQFLERKEQHYLRMIQNIRDSNVLIEKSQKKEKFAEYILNYPNKGEVYRLLALEAENGSLAVQVRSVLDTKRFDLLMVEVRAIEKRLEDKRISHKELYDARLRYIEFIGRQGGNDQNVENSD